MKTQEEIVNENFKHLPINDKNIYDFYRNLIVTCLEEYGKECYNKAIKDVIENVKTKEIKVYYTGVRAGGYTTKTVIDEESILKLKK